MITESDIKADIAGYRKRLDSVRAKLAALDPRGDAKNTYYKRRQARQVLEREIDHVQGLIDLAQDALAGKFENALANK